MHCEVCGAEIKGQARVVFIERTEMKVCNRCKKFAEKNTMRIFKQPLKRTIKPKPRKVSKEEYELIENYGTTIKKAREKREWTQEDLAKRLNEKTSVIARIETEKMIPDENLLKKLERLLEINLRQEMRENHLGVASSARSLTLGDIAKIKKKG
ncbi:MAG: multiprotein bridging factor aMBF1 [Candidatus Hydrothermarchaeota archaeon]